MEGERINFRIDTGADVSVINEDTAYRLKLEIQEDRASKLRDAGGKKMEKVGVMWANMQYRGKRKRGKFHVVKGAPRNLLEIPEV